MKEGLFMSKWDDFKKSVGAIADKTVTKTRELTDTASLKLKIASKEADRDTEYKNLGRLTYSKLKATDQKYSEALTLDISKTIEKLDGINSEIELLKAEEEARRDAKEAEKAEKAARKEAEKKAEEEEAARKNAERAEAENAVRGESKKTAEGESDDSVKSDANL